MINNNEKFAILTFYNANVNLSESFIKINEDLSIATEFPIEIDSHWKKWIGDIQSQKIKNSNLSIFFKQKVENPKIINRTNSECESKVYLFYCSLVTITELLCDYFPLQFTGAKYNNIFEIQSFSQMLKPEFVNGTPFRRIDQAVIDDAIQNYLALIQLSTIKKHSRIFRGINYFLDGITADDWKNKLHNYVRVIEAFINPEIGNTQRQFKSRTELFIGPSFHSLMEKIYAIRSNIEHVHEIQKGLDNINAIQFQKLTIVTQSISRYLLNFFLKNKNIWNFFEDSTIDEFWKLSPEKRKEIWPDIFDINSLFEEIDRLI
ncbi:hypothetical protein [Leptospira terpstrae]|uniref:Apea-like HEPN domain-containing protein n=1 Tax=Leptospira terpstrae serovar Hualin str. LT 11-33 = ATCC 700639 TaxID=1257025 RepID=N1VTJ2_9LEPT|nr:hypothetical protein [Leptospira terpstrae]EMY60292.1 hypothetical protein LEP1GSC203_0740 [Leptospira terpstrae serovar Hualin str. LT 11-33 = ATCC 700639]